MLHIAVCDDNIADRKQTERLLGRETTRWAEEGETLYADSFGNADSLLATPMSFDAFFLDICHTEGLSVLNIISGLRAKNINVPIILFCSDIDYRTLDLPSDIRFMNKPLSQERLHDILIELREGKDSLEKLFELRSENGTLYINADEIMYGDADGYNINIVLTDNRYVVIHETIESLYEEITPRHKQFVMPSENSIINVNYIKELGFRKAIMVDGKKYAINSEIKKYVNYFKAMPNKQ